MTDADGFHRTVAAEVRAEMGRQRVTGAQLARALGVSQAWVSERLRGERAFDLEELARVAAILGVEPTQFTGAVVP